MSINDHPSMQDGEDLLWISIQTTGVSPRKNRPLEIGLLHTTSNLEIIDGIQSYVGPVMTYIEAAQIDDHFAKIHQKSGLMDSMMSLPSLLPAQDVDFELAWWIAERFPQRATIAGINILGIRAWTFTHFPKIFKLCSARYLDISSVQQALKLWVYPEIEGIAKTVSKQVSAHRVEQDLLDAVNLAVFYRGFIIEEND